MRTRILFVGDLHLGRLPGRLPTLLTERGLQPAELSPCAAWENVVRWALQGQVDAVVLAGNVVESVEDLFEAYGDLSKGVRKLTEARVRVYAVAGSEDVVALPLLADRLNDFRLLGRGGVWSTEELEPRPGELVRLVGWSRSGQDEGGAPVAALPEIPDDGIPSLGVMHIPENSAAVRKALEASPLDAWLLGGRPLPDELAGPRPVGYLGAVVSMSAEEPGRYGPWLVTVHGPGELEVEAVPLAPLRWEWDEVPLDGQNEPAAEEAEENLVNRIHLALRRIVERVAPALGDTRAVGCRLRLTGTTRHHRRIADFIEGPRIAQLYEEWEGVPFFVEQIVDETSAAIDLEALARSTDPPGLLARDLLALRQGGEQAAAIVAAAERSLAPLAGNAIWSGIEQEPPPLHARELLLQAGTRLLEDLIAQSETQEVR